MSETLEIGGLTFEVRRSRRRQTLGLTVDRRGELRIHAPENTPAQELARWTRSKLLWVHRALARKEALAPKVRAPEFVSGENFSYLGQNYRLKLVRDAAESLHFDGNYFWLAEDARSEAEAHFRGIFRHAGVPIAVATIDGKFLLANHAAVVFNGYDERELSCASARHSLPAAWSCTPPVISRMATERGSNRCSGT